MAKNANFYVAGKEYWANIPATVDGMLGGFAFISHADIKGSKQFLKQLFHSKSSPGKQYALDCGAGIGRVSKFLLTDVFENVDLVEQNPHFLEQAKPYLGEKRLSKVGNFYQEGLQDFCPEKNKYDIIWIQWVLGHLTDDDLINFLQSCQDGLKPNGLIIIKENTTSSEEVEVDEVDSSVTRPVRTFRQLFTSAGLECYRVVKQNNFPKGIYAVHMFALKPKPIVNDISVNEQQVDIGLQSLNIVDYNNK